VKFLCPPSQGIANNTAENEINDAEEKFKREEIRKITGQHMLMPGDLTAVEIFNTQVKNNGKNEGEIQQDIEVAILYRAHRILHRNINTKGIKWFDQQVQEKQKGKIGDKFPFQGSSSLFPSQM
jgi:hypothetical protein